jgi:hypothetical protein
VNKHFARTAVRFPSFSQTSTVTAAINALKVQLMFFERGITLPGRSEVSLAATTPCRLQLYADLRRIASVWSLLCERLASNVWGSPQSGSTDVRRCVCAPESRLTLVVGVKLIWAVNSIAHRHVLKSLYLRKQ